MGDVVRLGTLLVERYLSSFGGGGGGEGDRMGALPAAFSVGLGGGGGVDLPAAISCVLVVSSSTSSAEDGCEASEGFS